MNRKLYSSLLILVGASMIFLILVFAYNQKAFRGNSLKLNTSQHTQKAHILSAHYIQQKTYYARQDPFIPEKSILFFGDSHIQGLCTCAIGNNCINYGIGGDTSLGLLNRMTQHESIETAKAIFIQIGVNDFKYMTEKEILTHIEHITQIVPKKTVLIFNSIFPIQQHLGNCTATNKNIQNLNSAFKQLCQEKTNCVFLDLYDNYIDANGNLSAEYCLCDGVHLNNRGYALWIHCIRDKLLALQIL